MTIKIQAYQKRGIKTDKIESEFEFCCWDDLKKWMKGFEPLHKCPECKDKIKQIHCCNCKKELVPYHYVDDKTRICKECKSKDIEGD